MTFTEDLIALISVLLGIVLIAVASQNIERTKGKVIKYHVMYAAIPLAGVFLAPFYVKSLLFSPLSVVVVGTAYPIYESMKAVCTIEEGDDTVWLTYWVVQGAISFSTEWVEGLAHGWGYDSTAVHWNMFEFFFYLWLCLPWTDGATIIFDYVVEPLVAPIIQPIVSRTEGIINKIIAAVMNAAHISVVWIAFEFLPPGVKRAVWLILGTAYPLASSMVSVTTPGGEDDTYWLTYWSCFGTLYIIVGFVEDFLGFFPGFYTVMIALTIYLMLPLFRGADEVFRNILVPIAGLHELLVRRDAEVLKKQALADVPHERRAHVLKEISASYLEHAKLYEKHGQDGYQAVVDSEIV